jgi:protein TonB
MKIAFGIGSLLFSVLLSGTLNLAASPKQRSEQTQTQQQSPTPEFVPAHLVAAWPIEYPIRSVAAGVVVVEVLIDDNGKVVDATLRRTIPSLTEATISAVKHWEYKAATRDGEPVSSRATVAVMFNPPVASSAMELSPLTSELISPRHRYAPEPPDVAAAFPAIYPMAYTGIDLFVAMNVDVSADGSVDSVKLVHGLKPLTETTQDALKKWQFKAARYDGKAISAPMTVAFVYRVPVTN